MRSIASTVRSYKGTYKPGGAGWPFTRLIMRSGSEIIS
jgi:hypothetical protein